MLDIRFVRENYEAVKDALKNRGDKTRIASFLKLDAERRSLISEVEDLKSQKNKLAKEIGILVSQGIDSEKAKSTVESRSRELSSKIDILDARKSLVQTKLDELMLKIPNIPDFSVPIGKNEESNKEVRTFGSIPRFKFPVKDHVELGGQQRDGELNFERASKISGARFSVMYGSIASLHRALVQFMLDTHTRKHGYQEVYVPFLVNADALRGTGQLPKFKADLFRLRGKKDLYLIPTAEVPVTNLVAGEILDSSLLPLKYVCHTPCFRSEAGSSGRDVKGMIRQHQFEKVELVQLVRPEDSLAALESLTGHAEAVLQALGLPYRVVVLCTGDMGFSSCKTYDIEVWIPSQNCYREISSCSSFGDFQSRRMQARYRHPDSGKPELLHTLNGSGLAVGRTLVAILENYQNADGSVTVPEALRPYLGGRQTL